MSPRPSDRSPVPASRGAGDASPSSRARKRFQQLIDRLRKQREDIGRWHAFRHVYRQRLADEYEPLAARLRDKRRALAILLDRAIEGESLGKRERNNARDILTRLLTDLLAEADDPELIRIYDKYAEISFEAERHERLVLLKALASEEFGVDVDAYQGGEAPQEFEDWLRAQAKEARAQSSSAEAAKTTGKSAKAAAREARLQQTAEGGVRVVRDVFRKLVSELHPDRETDPVEQARKTELMQRVNKAYNAGDLLTLLELQISIEQIDSSALAGLAEDRLRHYVHVLEEQSRELRDELAEIVAPFSLAAGNANPRGVTPAAVQRALDGDVRSMKATLRAVELDLLRFKNGRSVNASLGRYWIKQTY